MKQHSPNFSKLVQLTKQHITETSVTETKKKIDKGDAFFLIDVREDSEWKGGHLPHAIHLSKGIIERDIEKRIPNFNAPIVLYCGGGSRSALAAENLQKMGYTQVLSMDGGFRGWQEAGYTIESD